MAIYGHLRGRPAITQLDTAMEGAFATGSLHDFGHLHCDTNTHQACARAQMIAVSCGPCVAKQQMGYCQDSCTDISLPHLAANRTIIDLYPSQVSRQAKRRSIPKALAGISRDSHEQGGSQGRYCRHLGTALLKLCRRGTQTGAETFRPRIEAR